MLAKANSLPEPDVAYSFENKWDGFRCISEIEGEEVKLISRNGLSLNAKFPSIADELTVIKDNVIIDGEIVALNEHNKPEFQLIQNSARKKQKLEYYLFDILYLNGEITTALNYLERRELLELLFSKYKFRHIKLSAILKGEWQKLLKDAARKKSEGIIAKRNDGIYHPGLRTNAWLKLKVENNQSVLICGFTEPRGGRKKFGSIILGIYEKSELKYAGHCGSGFNDKTLRELYDKMKKFVVRNCPFKEIPPTNEKATWLKPALICEVKFTEWTRDGSLRHPVFKGLREDLEIKNIKREPILKMKNGNNKN